MKLMTITQSTAGGRNPGSYKPDAGEKFATSWFRAGVKEPARFPNFENLLSAGLA